MASRTRPKRTSQALLVKDRQTVATRPVMLLVLGMHRSGSSVCARLMECLGAANSTRTIPGDANNPKGYFEDTDVNTFNDAVLLPRLQRSWHSTASVDWTCLSDADRSRFALEAVQIIRKNYSPGEPLSVLKEPRIGALLPFWLSVLSHAGYEVRVVCALRDPVSVARSLGRRDKLSVAHSGLLFASYWLSIMSCIRHLPVAFVQFDEILAEPRRCLEKVARTLRLAMPTDAQEQLGEFRARFLDKDLRHHDTHPQDLDLEPEMPALTLNLYRLLLRAAQSQSLVPILKHLQTAEKEFGLLEPVLQQFDRSNNAFWQAQNRAAALQEEINRMQEEHGKSLPNAREHEGLTARIAALESEKSELASRQSSLAASVAKLQDANDGLIEERDALAEDGGKLHAALAAAKDETDQLRAKLVEAEKGRQELEAARERLNEQLDRARAESQTLAQERDTISGRMSSLVASHEELAARRASLAADLQALREKHSDLSSRHLPLVTALEELQARHSAASQEREGLTARIAALESEKSELAARHASLGASVQKLQDKNDGLIEERDALAEDGGKLRATLGAAKDETDQLKAKLAEAEKGRQELEASKDQLSGQLDQVRAEFRTLDTEREALRAERNEMAARLSTLDSEQSSLAARHATLASALEEAQARHAALLAERDELASARAALEAEQERSLLWRDALQDALEEAEERGRDLESNVQERFKELAELTGRLLSCEDREQKTSGERDALAAQLAAVESERSSLAAERSSLTTTLEELRTQRSALDSETQALRTERYAIAARLSSLESEHDALASRHSSLAASIGKLQEANDGLIEEREALAADGGKLRAALEAAKDETNQLKAKLIETEKSRADLEAARNRLSGQLDQVRAELQTLDKQQGGLQAEREQLLMRLQQSEEQLLSARLASRDYGDGGWAIGGTSVGQGNDNQPYRHLEFVFSGVQGQTREFATLRLRVVEHHGRLGFCVFETPGAAAPLEMWRESGREVGQPYMLVIPADKSGQAMLSELSAADRSLIATALAAAERAILARLHAGGAGRNFDPEAAWLEGVRSLRRRMTPQRNPDAIKRKM